MFLPTTKIEIKKLGWEAIDIVLITGDSYIDSPFIGVAVIGKVLLNAGFRVGIIAQPDLESDRDITRLGIPRLFWGVTGGCIDSMVANRTASGKRRKQDDYTPGGINDQRPDRAVIIYANLIRKYCKNTSPIVLGGLEASLRRIAHYDYWSNKIRRSILFDAKADYLLFGMAERSVVELAKALSNGSSPEKIRGLCYIANNIQKGSIELPSFEKAAADKDEFTRMFHLFYQNNDPVSASALSQLQDNRFLIQNPPAVYLNTDELDKIHALGFEREQHPYYAQKGRVKALETIRFSLLTHRGCFGECNFCSIAVHQGRVVRWRSKESIIQEAKSFVSHPDFKGIIFDVGGPTANMYGFSCKKAEKSGCCSNKRCLFPEICPSLQINHGKQIELLKELSQIHGVKKVFVASGLRYDLIMADQANGHAYLQQLVQKHVSGQLKVAPEHSVSSVLKKMGKPGVESLIEFKKLFDKLNGQSGKKQFLTYYIIAAHPGCRQKDMEKLKSFTKEQLGHVPEQIQIFTPTPSTYSSLMYWTEKDPFDNSSCFVEKNYSGRENQKNCLQSPVNFQKNRKNKR